MKRDGLRTWIEVDTKALKHNYEVFRRTVSKKCGIMAVVKSNAYGHSLVDFSRTIVRLGASWLGVDSIVEARALRREGIKKPILILGSTLPECFREAAQKNISVTISSFDALKSAVKRGTRRKPLQVHIKIDSGMHRQGFFTRDLAGILPHFRNPSTTLLFEGLYTHFAAAKNPAFPGDTDKQIYEFEKAISIVKSAGFEPVRHAAATSGTLLFPRAHYDMVRIGIGMYGLWPSREVQAAREDTLKLKPVLSWKTVISEIKNLPRGARVGYDLTEAVSKPSRVAILPVGYWHGYPRALSSIGHVIIHGKRAKIIGRVSMDMIAVDVTRIKNIRVGDEAVLVGDGMPADELANLAGTINYEIVTRINPLVKRIYV